MNPELDKLIEDLIEDIEIIAGIDVRQVRRSTMEIFIRDYTKEVIGVTENKRKNK